MGQRDKRRKRRVAEQIDLLSTRVSQQQNLQDFQKKHEDTNLKLPLHLNPFHDLDKCTEQTTARISKVAALKIVTTPCARCCWWSLPYAGSFDHRHCRESTGRNHFQSEQVATKRAQCSPERQPHNIITRQKSRLNLHIVLQGRGSDARVSFGERIAHRRVIAAAAVSSKRAAACRGSTLRTLVERGAT
jgi:hypothetical protein